MSGERCESCGDIYERCECPIPPWRMRELEEDQEPLADAEQAAASEASAEIIQRLVEKRANEEQGR